MEQIYTILIVEDEKSLRKALNEKLSRAGFRIIEAKNGKDGLKQAEVHKPNLILLDILMPKMNGIEMLKKIRGNASLAATPVVLLTNIEPRDEALMQDIVATEPTLYLMKSKVSLDEIVQKVRESVLHNA